MITLKNIFLTGTAPQEETIFGYSSLTVAFIPAVGSKEIFFNCLFANISPFMTVCADKVTFISEAVFFMG